VADFVPSLVDVTVMVVVPTPVAVTTPLVTVAILLFSVDHETPCGALNGNTEAVRVVVSPSTIETVVGVTLTLDTAIGLTVTGITTYTEELSTEVTLTVHEPTPCDAITPFVTVAIAASVVDHVTVLFVASAGSTVAVTVSDSPIVIVTGFMSTVISVTPT